MRRAGMLSAMACAGTIVAGAAPPVAISTEDVSSRGPFLSVELAPGPYTVGDRVEAVLMLSVPAAELDGEPRFPDWDGTWGEAEVIAAGEVERVLSDEGGEDPRAPEGGEDAEAGRGTAGATEPDARALYHQRVELAAFRPGEVALPPVAVTVPIAGGEVVLGTAELALTIDSVLPLSTEGTPEPEPMPPAPPQPLPLGARFWWTLAAGIAACVLALLWARMRRRHAAAAAATPPFEELRTALDAARRGDSPAAGHAAVSLAFRRWLGRVLRFPAAESSTAEIRRELSGRRLPEGAAWRAAALLAGCDLIKFARREATPGQLAERADAALGLATEIEDYLRPAPAVGSAVSGPGPIGREEAA